MNRGPKVTSRPHFQAKSLIEIQGGIDLSHSCVHGHKPSATRWKYTAARGPRHGVAACRPEETQACDLGSSLLPVGDAIPTKKLPPSPSGFGHQYRKFSLEGTAGPAVMPLGRFSFHRSSLDACLPEG